MMTVCGYNERERGTHVDEHLKTWASRGWRLHSTQLRSEDDEAEGDYVEHYFFWERD